MPCLASSPQVYCRSGNWGAAFQLSRRHGLDADVVYRGRWAAGPVNKEAILVREGVAGWVGVWGGGGREDIVCVRLKGVKGEGLGGRGGEGHCMCGRGEGEAKGRVCPKTRNS